MPTLNAFENVEFPAQLVGMPRDQRIQRVTDLFNDVGLSHRKDHLPDELSGGERQRVAIARALVHRPRLILADEPTGSLDQSTAKEIFNILYKLKDKNRLTIYATHNRFFANKADCLLEMINGSVKNINV